MSCPFSDQDIAHAIDGLPVAPRILAELAPRLQRIDVDLPDVAEAIRRDAGLAARLIGAANSVAYRGTNPATTLEDAIGRLGYRETFRILGAIASAHLANEPLRLYHLTPQRLRENALFVALVMEEIAPAAALEPRAAYTTGLLRSIGRVVLDRAAGTRGGIEPFAGTTAVAKWEQSIFGCSNLEVGARVLEYWRFPPEITLAVREHYAPAPTSPRNSQLLNLAAGAADLRDFGLPGEADYWQFNPETFTALGIDEGKFVWAGENAHKALTRISSALA